MELNKRNKIIIFICLILLGAVFLIFLFLKSDRLTQPMTTPIATSSQSALGAGDNAEERIIGQPQVVTLEQCQNLPEGSGQTDCLNQLKFNEIVGGSKNLKSCLEFNDFGYRDDCLYRLARVSKELVNCLRIAETQTKDKCIGDMAIGSLDKKLCEVFKDEPYEYQECQDRVDAFIPAFRAEKEATLDDCAKIKTMEYSRLCMLNLAKEGKTITGSTSNVEFAESFRSYTIYISAAKPEDCATINQSGAKTACLEKLKHPGYFPDTDQDGIDDYKELWFGTDPTKADTDGDGLSDYEEIMTYKTDSTNPDTDGDGVSDSQEVKNQTNPNDPSDKGKEVIKKDEKKWWLDSNSPNWQGNNWRKDSDNDGLIDLDEVFYLTDPFNPDTDDGVPDGQEIKNLTNPLGSGDLDFDGDGLTDKEELKAGTNPSLKDTNDDGVTDYDAVRQGIEAVSLDTDGDGLNNSYEKTLGTNMFKKDTDGDGLTDREEMEKYQTDPLKADTDGDGHTDGEEVKNGFDPNGPGKLNTVNK